MSVEHARQALAARIGRGGGGHGGHGSRGGHSRGHRDFAFGPGGWGPDYDLSLIDCAPGANFPGWACDPSGHWHRVSVSGFGAVALPSMPSWAQALLPFSDDTVKSPTLTPNKRWIVPVIAGAAIGALLSRVLS